MDVTHEGIVSSCLAMDLSTLERILHQKEAGTRFNSHQIKALYEIKKRLTKLSYAFDFNFFDSEERETYHIIKRAYKQIKGKCPETLKPEFKSFVTQVYDGGDLNKTDFTFLTDLKETMSDYAGYLASIHID